MKYYRRKTVKIRYVVNDKVFIFVCFYTKERLLIKPSPC